MSSWLLWLIIVACLVLLAFLKVGIYVSYCDDRFLIKLIIWKFRFVLGNKAEENAVKKVRAQARSELGARKAKKSVWVRLLLDHWQEILELLGKILTAPTLDVFSLCVSVGGGDPEACAMTYGRICALVSFLLPPLENTFLIKKRKIDIYPSFDEKSLKISCEVAATLRIYELISLLMIVLSVGLQLYRQIKLEKKVV